MSCQVEIVGAGPAGLSAAISARAAGASVEVFEKRPDVGARFHGDFQGLENWTSDKDVLCELEELGIQSNFDHSAVHEVVCFDPAGAEFSLLSSKPLFYLVRRGSGAGTIDQSLKNQALASGVTIHFKNRQRNLVNGGVVAEGPHRPDVIAAGYVFETDMADGYYAAIGERLAPAGYSYLLVCQGKGTVATCMFKQFHDERACVERTIDFFKQRAGLRWSSATRFGGSGNFGRVKKVTLGARLYAGESAGFQDALFGFGLRYAFISGSLAGQSCALGQTDYDQRCQTYLGGLNKAAVFNRWLYSLLGDRGRQHVLDRFVKNRDPRYLLGKLYAPTRWKSLLAMLVPQSPLIRPEQYRSNCDCSWCRCHRKSSVPARTPDPVRSE